MKNKFSSDRLFMFLLSIIVVLVMLFYSLLLLPAQTKRELAKDEKEKLEQKEAEWYEDRRHSYDILDQEVTRYTTRVNIRKFYFANAYVLGAHLGEVDEQDTIPHRHLNEAVIYILSGRGYTTIKPLGSDKEVRVDWRPGTILHIPSFALHGHVKTSKEPARMLAVTARREGIMEVYRKAVLENDEFLIKSLGLPTLAQVKERLNSGELISDRELFEEGKAIEESKKEDTK